MKPAIIKHIVPTTTPMRSSEIGTTPTMAVSLPAPPKGVTFGKAAK